MILRRGLWQGRSRRATVESLRTLTMRGARTASIRAVQSIASTRARIVRAGTMGDLMRAAEMGEHARVALARRRRPRVVPSRDRARAHRRLWTASMYTDDGHFAILSIDLMICGLRVWRRITGELRLTMAIIQKHGLGQLVTHQGFRFNTGLGLVYVPEDKARRALEQLDAALAGTINLSNYASLLGLLQSMLFVMGMRKAST